jgi:hypothetical protein
MARTILWGSNPKNQSTATMGPYWRWVTNGAIHASNGYDGSACLTFDAGSGFTTTGTPAIAEDPNIATIFPEDHGQPVLSAEQNHFFMGSRFYISSYPATDPLPIFLVLNEEQFVQCMLTINTDGTLSVYRSIGAGKTLLWTSSFTMPTGAHHRLGWLGRVAKANGWFDVYLDDVVPGVPEQKVFIDGLNTAQHDLVPFRGVGFGGDANVRHSHMYMGCGIPVHNDLIRRGAFLANYMSITGVGAEADWVPNTGTIATAIDDTTPDDGTTYIQAGAQYEEFSVEVDAIGDTRLVYGVQVEARYQRPAESAISLRIMNVNGTRKTLAPLPGGGVDDWAVQRALWRTNTTTGTSWSGARVDAQRWGGRAV